MLQNWAVNWENDACCRSCAMPCLNRFFRCVRFPTLNRRAAGNASSNVGKANVIASVQNSTSHASRDRWIAVEAVMGHLVFCVLHNNLLYYHCGWIALSSLHAALRSVHNLSQHANNNHQALSVFCEGAVAYSASRGPNVPLTHLLCRVRSFVVFACSMVISCVRCAALGEFSAFDRNRCRSRATKPLQLLFPYDAIN